MPILIDKVLSALAFPLGLAIAGLLFAWLLIAFRATKTGLTLGGCLILLLWTVSTPRIADLLLRSLESQYPLQSVENYPPVDVVIVLGGALSPAGPHNPYPDLGEASDRFIHAFRIFKAGKARKILISGGAVFDPFTRNTEAMAMADLLVSVGVDRRVILIEDRSRNTYENALGTLKLWQAEAFRSGLLVTSASHMPRALAVFRKAGMKVEPASTDVNATAGEAPFPLPFLPNADSLASATKALKEWLGLAVYRWRGWA